MIAIYSVFGDFKTENNNGLKLNGVISILLIMLSLIAAIVIQLYEFNEDVQREIVNTEKEKDNAARWEKLSGQMKFSIDNQAEVTREQTKASEKQTKILDQVQKNMFPIEPITINFDISFSSIPESVSQYSEVWDEFIDVNSKANLSSTISEYHDGILLRELSKDTTFLKGVTQDKKTRKYISEMKANLVYKQQVFPSYGKKTFSHIEIFDNSKLLRTKENPKNIVFNPNTGETVNYDTLFHKYRMYIIDTENINTAESLIKSLPKLMHKAPIKLTMHNLDEENIYRIDYTKNKIMLNLESEFRNLITKENNGSLITLFDLIGKTILLLTPFEEGVGAISGEVNFDPEARQNFRMSRFFSNSSNLKSFLGDDRTFRSNSTLITVKDPDGFRNTTKSTYAVLIRITKEDMGLSTIK
jgi:hypothetical protein